MALCAFNDTCLCEVIINKQTNKQTNKQILYDNLPDLINWIQMTPMARPYHPITMLDHTLSRWCSFGCIFLLRKYSPKIILQIAKYKKCEFTDLIDGGTPSQINTWKLKKLLPVHYGSVWIHLLIYSLCFHKTVKECQKKQI